MIGVRNIENMSLSKLKLIKIKKGGLWLLLIFILSSCDKYRFWNLAKLAAFNTPVVSNN